MAAANVTIIPARDMQPEVLRVAAYCRVSSDSTDQIHSYATQIRSYTDLISRHPEWEMVDIYADEGLTGTRMDKREDFQRMMADCRKGEIDVILVKSISRFARNTRDCLTSIRELRTLGVSVQFEKENLDTKTLSSEMMLSVFGALAQQESISISENLRISYKRRMEKGEFLTAHAPLGYNLTAGCQMKIDSESAELVHWIFDNYVNGVSSTAIAEILTEKRIATPTGNSKWLSLTIRGILTNEKYIGDCLCQKKYTSDTLPFKTHKNCGQLKQYYIENSHPALISRAQFSKVQQLLAIRRNQNRCTHADSPFCRKIICGNCGTKFIRIISKTGYICYACRKHNEKASDCPTGRIPELELYIAFFRRYNKLKTWYSEILEPVLIQINNLKAAMQKDSPKLMLLNQQIASLAQQDHNLTQLVTNGFISTEISVAKRQAISQEITLLRRKRRSMLRDDSIEDAAASIEETIHTIQEGPERLSEFSNELFDSLVESITAESSTRIQFHLYGGLTFAEQLQEVVR